MKSKQTAVQPNLGFRIGMLDGLPIALGYFSVSFAFGMLAIEKGVPLWGPVLISLTSFTGTGQFVGVDLLSGGAALMEIAFTLLIINLRYLLMSLSLSQRMSPCVGLWAKALHRLWSHGRKLRRSHEQNSTFNFFLYARPDFMLLHWMDRRHRRRGIGWHSPSSLCAKRPWHRFIRYVYCHFSPSCAKRTARVDCNRHRSSDELLFFLSSGTESVVRRMGHYYLRSSFLGNRSVFFSHPAKRRAANRIKCTGGLTRYGLRKALVCYRSYGVGFLSSPGYPTGSVS